MHGDYIILNQDGIFLVIEFIIYIYFLLIIIIYQKYQK